MSTSYWFRVGMMALALIAVLFIMRRLNQTPAQVQGWGLTTPKSPVAATVNLCPTRVTRLEAEPAKVSIFEKDMTWYRRAGESAPQVLDPVAVEKWFSQNCLLNGIKVSASADVHTALKVFFVSGEPQILLQSAGGEYEWMGLPFSSPQMDDALQGLLNLPAKEVSK